MTPVETVITLSATVVVLLSALFVVRRYGSRWETGVVGVAILGHALFAILVLPRLPYRWDIETFDQAATATQSGLSGEASMTVDSFAAPQAVLYTTFIPDPTIVAIFNGLCAVLVVLPIADLAGRLYPTLDTTRALMVTVLFLPLSFAFLTIPMRDALDVLLFFTFLAAIARAYDGQRWPAVLVIPLWGALYLLRPELGVILVAAVLAGTAVHLLDELMDRSPTLRGMAALASIPGLAGLFVVGPRLPVESFSQRVQFRASGGAAYLEHMSYAEWTDILLAAPVRALYFQYAPFPLHATSAFDFVTAAVLPVLVVLSVAAYRSVHDCERDIAVLVLLLTTYVLGIVGYGLIDSNFGTTVRHRIPFTFILCLLAAPTLERWGNLLLGPVGADAGIDGTSAFERVGDRPD